MTRIPGRASRSGIQLALIAVLLLAAAMPVMAVNFGSNVNHPCDTTVNSECVANNGIHTVYFGTSAVNVFDDGVRWSITNVYNPVRDVSASVTTSTPADAQVYDYTYGLNNLYGWTFCASNATYGGTDPDRWCRPQNVYLNTTYAGTVNTTAERRYLGCHELGHTLGLQHQVNSTSSCSYDNGINKGIVPNAIDTHDTNNLNAQY